jgi:hypothetical protein
MPGPYVTMATLCEKVLREADGVISVIRSIDRLMIQAQGEEVPAELPQGQVSTTLVVCLKADDARGRHPVSVEVQLPSGATLPPQTVDVMFEGEERGVNLILNIQVEAMEGLYWFDVSVNSQLLTRVPLRLMYQRVPSGG